MVGLLACEVPPRPAEAPKAPGVVTLADRNDIGARGERGLLADETGIYIRHAGGIEWVPADGAKAVKLSGTPERDFHLDATHVYIAMHGDRDATKIVRVPKHGGEPAVVADKLTTVGVLAVDDENVYWSDMDNDEYTVSFMPKLGGPRTTIKTNSTQQQASKLWPDATHVYLWDGAGVKALSKRESTAKMLVEAGIPVFASGPDLFVWMSGGNADDPVVLHRMPKAGGRSSPLFLERDLGNGPAVVDDGHVYFAGPRGILRVSFTDPAITRLVETDDRVSELVVHGGSLYWTDGRFVRKCPKEGINPKPLKEGNDPSPYR